MKHKVGRPRKWETREELIGEINDYFAGTEPTKYTVTGLTLALGTSRQTLDNYQAREEFKDIIDEAKLIVENSYELSLRENGRSGDIFALKNFGWEDRKKEEITGEGGGPLEVDTGLDITVHKAREYESDDELDNAFDASRSVE